MDTENVSSLQETREKRTKPKEVLFGENVPYSTFGYWVKKFRTKNGRFTEIKTPAREGINIPPSTLSDNIAAVCQVLLPLYNALKREVIASLYLQADETTIKVLEVRRKAPPSGLLLGLSCSGRWSCLI